MPSKRAREIAEELRKNRALAVSDNVLRKIGAERVTPGEQFAHSAAESLTLGYYTPRKKRLYPESYGVNVPTIAGHLAGSLPWMAPISRLPSAAARVGGFAALGAAHKGTLEERAIGAGTGAILGSAFEAPVSRIAKAGLIQFTGTGLGVAQGQPVGEAAAQTIPMTALSALHRGRTGKPTEARPTEAPPTEAPKFGENLPVPVKRISRRRGLPEPVGEGERVFYGEGPGQGKIVGPPAYKALSEPGMRQLPPTGQVMTPEGPGQAVAGELRPLPRGMRTVTAAPQQMMRELPPPRAPYEVTPYGQAVPRGMPETEARTKIFQELVRATQEDRRLPRTPEPVEPAQVTGKISPRPKMRGEYPYGQYIPERLPAPVGIRPRPRAEYPYGQYLPERGPIPRGGERAERIQEAPRQVREARAPIQEGARKGRPDMERRTPEQPRRKEAQVQEEVKLVKSPTEIRNTEEALKYGESVRGIEPKITALGKLEKEHRVKGGALREKGKLDEATKEFTRAQFYREAAETAKLPKKAKEPWEMTRDEVIEREYGIKNPSDHWPLGKDNMPLTPEKYLQMLPSSPVAKTALQHKKSVRAAFREGKPVPERVLKGYPELAAAEKSKISTLRKELKSVHEKYEKAVLEGDKKTESKWMKEINRIEKRIEEGGEKLYGGVPVPDRATFRTWAKEDAAIIRDISRSASRRVETFRKLPKEIKTGLRKAGVYAKQFFDAADKLIRGVATGLRESVERMVRAGMQWVRDNVKLDRRRVGTLGDMRDFAGKEFGNRLRRAKITSKQLNDWSLKTLDKPVSSLTREQVAKLRKYATEKVETAEMKSPTFSMGKTFGRRLQKLNIKDKQVNEWARERFGKTTGKLNRGELAQLKEYITKKIEKMELEAEKPIEGGIGKEDPTHKYIRWLMFESESRPFAGRNKTYYKKKLKEWVGVERIRDIPKEKVNTVIKKLLDLQNDKDVEIFRRGLWGDAKKARELQMKENRMEYILREMENTTDPAKLEKLKVGFEKTQKRVRELYEKDSERIKEVMKVYDKMDSPVIGLLAHIRPAWRVFLDMGPRYFKVWENFNEAGMKMENIQNTVLASCHPYTKALKKAIGRKGMKEELEKITAYMDENMKSPKLTPEGKALAEHLKSQYDFLYKEFGIEGKAGYVKGYTPRVRAKKMIESLIDDYAKRTNMPEEWIGFMFKKRVGNLMEREMNALELLRMYTAAGAKTKYLDPILKEYGPFMNRKNIKGQEFLKQEYLKQFTQRVMGIPTKADLVFENTIRGVAKSLGQELPDNAARNMARFFIDLTYSGGLGFRPMTALRNLTQTNLSFAEIGPKYVVKGLEEFRRRGMEGAIADLKRKGVIREFHPEQDLSAKAIKSQWDTLKHYSLWMFSSADKINRIIAYYGGRAKLRDAWQGQVDQAFLRKSGLNKIHRTMKESILEKLERDGIDVAADAYGYHVQAKTQYLYTKFGSPLITQSTPGKVVFQFQTWWTNYAELLREWMINKNWQSMGRWALATFAMVYGGGQAGLNTEKWIGLSPFPMTKDEYGGVTLPLPPVAQLAINSITAPIQMGRGVLKEVGKEPGAFKEAAEAVKRQQLNQLAVFFPGGVALRDAAWTWTNEDMEFAQKALRTAGLPIPRPR